MFGEIISFKSLQYKTYDMETYKYGQPTPWKTYFSFKSIEVTEELSSFYAGILKSTINKSILGGDCSCSVG